MGIDDDDSLALALEDTSNVEVRVRVLAFRVSTLTREKEKLERKIERLELAYNMGRGIFWIAPFIVAVSTFFWYNWVKITGPWK